MYWVMMSERSNEYELSIDGTPPLIEQHDWRFDCGVKQPAPLPVIDVPFEIQPDERMVDNIPAYGCRGLLINDRVKAVFDGLKIDNIQYYSARLVNQDTGQILSPYWIANILGKIACVDHSQSDLDYYDDGKIRFIDKLALTPMPGSKHARIFRLAEFLPVMIVSDMLKNALTEHKITGFTFYKPEDFSL
jgi:hypothetical protein